MNVTPIILIICVIVGTQALFWSLIYWRFRTQITSLREEFSQGGERLLAGPEIAFYQGSINGIISIKTNGVLVLTDRRVLFRKPIGADIDILLTSVVEVAESRGFQGNYRAGKTFLVLKCQEGTQVGFIVKDATLWHRAIASHIG